MAEPLAPTLLIAPCEDEAPCELPKWCSPPDGQLSDAGIEIWRIPACTAPEPIILGNRAWFHFGRRHTAATAKAGRQPDVELRTCTASRKQALLLRNWHGQVFVMDIGSSHGTFLGHQRLQANVAKEWKPGVRVFFSDRSLETFELLPRRLRLPLLNPSLGSLDGLVHDRVHGTARTGVSISAKFVGARRMMGAQLAQVAPDRRETDPGSYPSRRAMERTEAVTASEPPLYPGEWQVSADGLSAIGWKPGEMERTASSETGSTRTRITERGSAGSAALQRPALAVRMERKLRSQFGPDISRNLHAWGAHYPCPEHGPGWQFSLYTKTSAPFDPSRPATVLTAAVMKQDALRLEWLGNIPASRLHLRLTIAPPEVAEPAPVGLWQLDLPLPAEAESKACVFLPSSQRARLPSKFFVRICCKEALTHRGVPLGFEFASSLIPLSFGGFWAIDQSSLEAASTMMPLGFESHESPHNPPSAGTSPVSPGTEGMLSSTSCASHASTLVASSDVSGRVHEKPSGMSSDPPAHKAHASPQTAAVESMGSRLLPPPAKVQSKKSRTRVSNREFVTNYCQRFFAEQRSRKRRQEHASDSSDECAPTHGNFSEEELMSLSPAQLLRYMRQGIRSHALTSPDFKCGRLRAAYSQALERLCDDGRIQKRSRRTRG